MKLDTVLVGSRFTLSYGHSIYLSIDNFFTLWRGRIWQERTRRLDNPATRQEWEYRFSRSSPMRHKYHVTRLAFPSTTLAKSLHFVKALDKIIIWRDDSRYSACQTNPMLKRNFHYVIHYLDQFDECFTNCVNMDSFKPVLYLTLENCILW